MDTDGGKMRSEGVPQGVDVHDTAASVRLGDAGSLNVGVEDADGPTSGGKIRTCSSPWMIFSGDILSVIAPGVKMMAQY